MNPIAVNLLYALATAAPAAAPATTGVRPPGWLLLLQQIVPLLLIGLAFYFILIAPQRRKQKETQRMIDAVAKGDRVTTVGGIHGTVVQVGDGDVTLKVDESSNTKIRFQKSALAAVEQKDAAAPKA